MVSCTMMSGVVSWLATSKHTQTIITYMKAEHALIIPGYKTPFDPTDALAAQLETPTDTKDE